MATPPNPFDQHAVDDYLAEQQRRTAEREANQSNQAPPGTGSPVQDTDPAVEAQVMMDYWARRGPEVLSTAMVTIAEELTDMAAGIEESGTDQEHLAVTLTAADLGKRLRDTGATLYAAARTALWSCVGLGTHDLDDGRRFEFKTGAKPRRSTDYKVLEKFPAAYAAAVKVSQPDPDTPGVLSIKGVKK